jgi:hypothetical protein
MIPITVDVLNESSSTVQKVSVWLIRKTEPVIPEKFKHYGLESGKFQIIERKKLSEIEFPHVGK